LATVPSRLPAPGVAICFRLPLHLRRLFGLTPTLLHAGRLFLRVRRAVA
jgi:hypothetical protein